MHKKAEDIEKLLMSHADNSVDSIFGEDAQPISLASNENPPLNRKPTLAPPTRTPPDLPPTDAATESPPLNTTPTLAPPTRPPPDLPSTDGQSRGGNNSSLIGIIIGSVAAVILVVVLFVLWYKRRCNKSKQNPIYVNEEPPAVSSPAATENPPLNTTPTLAPPTRPPPDLPPTDGQLRGEDISPKQNNNFNRRLPSLPPSITVYQNENCNGFEEEGENPYTDLNYIYVCGSYSDLRSQNN
ncbi:uncharacterized protein [Dendropsophus ebraccatus]|uniref:uncharacterized protein n=1 Tax=Dendropsophus ebraccatus TaxID=150705 RepID=UPI003831C9B4